MVCGLVNGKIRETWKRGIHKGKPILLPGIQFILKDSIHHYPY